MSQAGMREKNLQLSLNPFEPLPTEMSLCNYKNLLVLGASLLKYVRTEWMSFKYHIKTCSKNKHKEKPKILKVMNRNILNILYEVSA